MVSPGIDATEGFLHISGECGTQKCSSKLLGQSRLANITTSAIQYLSLYSRAKEFSGHIRETLIFHAFSTTH